MNILGKTKDLLLASAAIFGAPLIAFLNKIPDFPYLKHFGAIIYIYLDFFSITVVISCILFSSFTLFRKLSEARQTEDIAPDIGSSEAIFSNIESERLETSLSMGNIIPSSDYSALNSLLKKQGLIGSIVLAIIVVLLNFLDAKVEFILMAPLSFAFTFFLTVILFMYSKRIYLDVDKFDPNKTNLTSNPNNSIIISEGLTFFYYPSISNLKKSSISLTHDLNMNEVLYGLFSGKYNPHRADVYKNITDLIDEKLSNKHLIYLLHDSSRLTLHLRENFDQKTSKTPKLIKLKSFLIYRWNLLRSKKILISNSCTLFSIFNANYFELDKKKNPQENCRTFYQKYSQVNSNGLSFLIVEK